jgi:hypothetical protein
MQTLQAGSLVGRDVLVQGNRLAIDEGKASGAIDLDLPADKVVVDILSSGGVVLESFNLGALGAGRNAFEWDAKAHSSAEGLTYRVTATKGSTVVTNRTFVQDKRALGRRRQRRHERTAAQPGQRRLRRRQDHFLDPPAPIPEPTDLFPGTTPCHSKPDSPA